MGSLDKPTICPTILLWIQMTRCNYLGLLGKQHQTRRKTRSLNNALRGGNSFGMPLPLMKSFESSINSNKVSRNLPRRKSICYCCSREEHFHYSCPIKRNWAKTIWFSKKHWEFAKKTKNNISERGKIEKKLFLLEIYLKIAFAQDIIDYGSSYLLFQPHYSVTH